MRILHTIPGRNWGGMEFRVIEQVGWLNAHGHQAWLATPEDGESFRRAKALGLPVIDVDFSHPWRLSSLQKLRALIAGLKVDVADVHVTRDAKALMACLDLVAVVRSRHITQRLKPGIMRSWQWRLGADRVIAVAGCIQELMIQDGLIDPMRSDTVGEWADDVFFAKVPAAERLRQRGELGLDEGRIAIACVGMLRPEKGQDVLIDALALLPPAYHVLMIGAATGEGDDHAKALAARAKETGIDGRIHWLGYRSDVASLLAAADVVAVPSLLDAQSRIVPQAFAACVPVVASQVGGLPELVEEGVTGLLVPPGDAAALAQSLRRLTGDPDLAARLVGNASRLAEIRLRMDRQMEATLAVYAKALERAQGRTYLRVEKS